MDPARLLAEGDLEGARRAVLARARGGVPADAAFAVAAEGAGLGEVAIAAWRGVLARRPDDPEALAALVRLHEARGDTRRAEACRARLGAPEPDPEPEEPAPDAVGAGDLARFVHLFGGRAGVHARMWARGGEVGYAPIRAGLDPERVLAHLRGDETVGAYLVRHGDLCGQLVLDLDLRPDAIARASGDPAAVADLAARVGAAGLVLRNAVVAAGVPCVLADSGYKGRHVWIFVDPPAPAARVRAVGVRWAAALAPADPALALEVFPRQDAVPADGLGNLVKLPLGLHLRTGRRCAILGPDGQAVDPWPAVRVARAVPIEALEAAPLPAAPSAAPAAEGALPLVAVAAPAAFTEADFELRPRLAALGAGCAVVRDVLERAVRDRRLLHDERVTLEQTLGHWPEGVEAVNWLLDRIGAPGERMGRPLQGCPISCKAVRKRLRAVADRVGCDCRLEDPDTYPNPLLHARGVPAEAPQVVAIDDVLERLGRLEARARAVAEELAAARAEAAGALRTLGRVRAVGGEWWVEDREGLPVVRFEAKP